jgi:hypothetical protein
MKTPVKERIQAELDQAKEDGKLRAERIGDILKSAASLTFEELKAGSAELNVQTRKSLAELLEDLQENPEMTEAEYVASQVQVPHEPAATEAQPAPSWKEIITQTFKIVRDRRGDWFQQLKDYWNQHAAKFDQDMTEEYGDRYLKAKALRQRIFAWLAANLAKAKSDSSHQDDQPATVEVVDNDKVTIDSPVLTAQTHSEEVQ